MYTPSRRYNRPLGHYVPESKIELLAEKAMFRHHSQVLRDMCDRRMRQNQQRQQFNILGDQSDNPIIASLFQQRRKVTAQHSHAVSVREEDNSKISPDVRWLLTRSARIQRVNNAGYSTFRNRIKDRVVSADGRRQRQHLSIQRQRSMCSRNDHMDTPNSRQQRLQCDVLGPKFCTDCTEISQKTKVLRKQEVSFPRIEVHTRSLVAPEKVEKIYLSNPKEMFHQEKHYACGCSFNPQLEITTPIVYTPHEVFERIRKKKQLEYEKSDGALTECGTDATGVHNSDRTSENDCGSTPSITTGALTDRPFYLDDRPSFFEEKTEPPMDLSVSVKIVHNGH